MKTEILLDHEPVADGGWLVRALLTVTGEARPAEGRVPLNLSVVLDRSGSMMGGKLKAAKEAARLLVQRLWPEDVVSVVAYDEGVATVAPPATGEAQADLGARIAGIEAGSTTNLSGGWLQGRDHVAAGRRDGAVNRVLLLTDGLANVGITDPETLTGLCRTAAAEHGITTTTIGFGDGYAEELLRAMADAGGGALYYIEEPDQAPGVFEEELEGLLSIAAQNLSVRIEPASAVEEARVLHDYPSRAEGDALVLAVGDLYAREPRRLLAEFLLQPPAEGEEEAEVEVATLTVTADVLTADGGVEKRTVTLPVRLSPQEGGLVDPVVEKEKLLLEAARSRKEALRQLDEGDFDAAGESLRVMSETLAYSPHADEELREEAADLGALADRAQARIFEERDRKYAYHRAHDVAHSKREAVKRYARGTRKEDDEA